MCETMNGTGDKIDSTDEKIENTSDKNKKAGRILIAVAAGAFAVQSLLNPTNLNAGGCSFNGEVLTEKPEGKFGTTFICDNAELLYDRSLENVSTLLEKGLRKVNSELIKSDRDNGFFVFLENSDYVAKSPNSKNANTYRKVMIKKIEGGNSKQIGSILPEKIHLKNLKSSEEIKDEILNLINAWTNGGKINYQKAKNNDLEKNNKIENTVDLSNLDEGVVYKLNFINNTELIYLEYNGVKVQGEDANGNLGYIAFDNKTSNIRVLEQILYIKNKNGTEEKYNIRRGVGCLVLEK